MTEVPGSFYVGAGRPRLQLSSWSDVEIAAASGVLGETAWAENKKAVPASSRPANLELARDLASLSVDGGLLIIGVTDDLEVVGTTESAHALRTRITQVASTVINPPLFVEVVVLEAQSPTTEEADSDDASSSRLVVISVPASGSAPHMVDQRYWGRNDLGKRSLSDSEVERIMASRLRQAKTVDVELQAVEGELGPLMPDAAERGHLTVAAIPTGHVGTTMTAALADVYVPQLINEASDFRASWAPWASGLSHHRPHPDGILVSSDDERYDITVPEEYAFRLLFRDDGAVLFAGGGATMSMPLRDRDGERKAQMVVCGYILEALHRVTRIAGFVAAEHLGYWGSWHVGVYLTQMRGCYPTSRANGDFGSTPFPASDYLRTTVSTTREMLDEPPLVVGRMALPLLRSLGVDRRFLPYRGGSEIRARNEAV